MFLEHQPMIAEFAQAGPENLYRVLEFVQCTINQRFYHVPLMIRQIHENGTSPMLNACQKQALLEYRIHRTDIYDVVMDAEAERAMRYLVNLPNLGIVKAGFVLQLARGRVGCLDVHNQRRFGLAPKMFRTDGPIERLHERIQAYIAICESYGTARLWDEWCELIAAKYPKHFASAYDASVTHVQCILNEEPFYAAVN